MSRKVVLVALILALHLPQVASGQEAPSPAVPERGKIVAAAREVMAGARYCTFVTIGSDGHPQARIVDPFEPEEDLTVWVGTKPNTRKVAELRKDPRVTLCYFDPKNMGYVTLLGRAELVQDPAEKAKHWKQEWAALYKDENRGDDYLLIRIKASRIEIVSLGHGLTGDPVTWVPAALDLP